MIPQLWLATLMALTGVTTAYAACAQVAKTRNAGADSGWSLSPPSARPVTVADLIGMTTIGSRVQGYPTEDYDVLSPNGSLVAVVVNRGNLERNTVDFALLVFRTADRVQTSKPDTVVVFASSSNRPGIAHVRWLSDNATLVFLGEQPGELPQVYSVDARTRKLTRRTHAATVITAFDVGQAGDPVVYAAAPPRDTSGYGRMRTRGFVLAPRVLISDAMAGDWGLQVSSSWAGDPRALHVVRGDGEAIVSLPDSAAGYRWCNAQSLSVAPSGDVALLQCELRRAPLEWKGYQRKDFRHFADLGFVFPEYVVVDLESGRVHPLIDAPVFGTTFVWASDGKSVAVANVMLPAEASNAAERTARAAREMLAEIDVHSGAVTIIARQDSLTALAWDPHSATVQLAPGGYPTPTEARRVYYRKTQQGWVLVSAGKMVTAPVPAFVIDRGLNTPDRLVAVNPRSNDRKVIYDPNPGLLTAHRFGREEAVHWKTRAGAAWVGGLYWPPDYVPGRRYPLVIQTHGFDSTAFWPYGIFSTGEAAQPLANQGVMVLQMSEPPYDQEVTRREAPLFMEGAEGAIDYLDGQGLIEREKVGMQGFSRTCFHTLYFLTHSRYPIAAATVTDGVDFSYMQHMIFGPTYMGSGEVAEDLKVYGGEPFGVSLAAWMEGAPGFNLGRITAPLQLTSLTAPSLLTEWEPYAGLLLQGKPAEMIYIPDGAHILTKPWERMTSEQGAVDWFCFWLKGDEAPDSVKTEQYARWHRLRVMRDSNAVKSAKPTRGD